MSEIVLGLVVIALVGYIGYSDRLNRQERAQMVRALKAKNAQELRDLEVAANTRITVEPEPLPDLIPESEAPQALWEKAIRAEAEEDGI